VPLVHPLELLTSSRLWLALPPLLVILLVSWLAMLLGSRLIERVVGRLLRKRPPQDRAAFFGETDFEMATKMMFDRRAQHVSALGNLFKSLWRLLVAFMALLWMLDSLGVNLVPLLAGAGIVAGVVGFGAQSLVADIIAGTLIIFQDQLGIGDSVKIGEVLGQVREVNLYNIRIRDSWGVVWYIRNSQVTFLANQSKGWTWSLVRLPVPYDADLRQVETIINTKIHGNENQWWATRIVQQAMKEALDQNGIRIPFEAIEVETRTPIELSGALRRL
jgi:moderate conductance mechanosensitive channel